MCGVGAIVSLDGTIKNPGNLSANLLHGSKNRGQDGYGLSIRLEDGEIHTFKFRDFSPELVMKVNEFSDRATAIITHARYPTSGGSGYRPEYVQPFEERQHDSRFAFAFNGNIVNAGDIAKTRNYPLTQDPVLDTEVLKFMIHEQFDRGITDHRVIAQSINDVIDGCCNMALLGSDGSVSLSKDRWGFRPFVYAQEGGLLVASSESSTIFRMGYAAPIFVRTGEMVEINPWTKEVNHSRMNLHLPKEKSRCFFEGVYFADEKTELWGMPSSLHRYRLGQALAQRDISEGFSTDGMVVVDIPASAKHSAQGYADTMQLHLIPAITKNPDAKRTFIAEDRERAQMIQRKYIFNAELKPFIQGKKVVLVDDSIVRGNTMAYLVETFRAFYEPSEVHLRIPSPPIVAPCFYGIDMAKVSELVARKYFKNIKNPKQDELQGLAKLFHADSMQYITLPMLIDAMRLNVDTICMGCTTGEYPTPCGQKKYDNENGS